MTTIEGSSKKCRHPDKTVRMFEVDRIIQSYSFTDPYRSLATILDDFC